MALDWKVTSLVALALLGCFTGTKAQFSKGQKPAPPPQAPQVPQPQQQYQPYQPQQPKLPQQHQLTFQPQQPKLPQQPQQTYQPQQPKLPPQPQQWFQPQQPKLPQQPQQGYQPQQPQQTNQPLQSPYPYLVHPVKISQYERPQVLPPPPKVQQKPPQYSQVYPRGFPDFQSPQESEVTKPYQPNEPQQPHQPYQPEQPYQPQQPHQPYQPEQPYQPQQPHQPQQTEQPYQPQQPHQPYQPEQPYQPQHQQQPTSPQAPSSHPQSVSLQPSTHSCDVAGSQRVPCGGSDISAAACEAISCCFDGRQCYFGKAVTVQCTKDAQFIVVVARDATLPNIDLESISLLGQGQGCTHIASNSEFAIYQFPISACGTVVMEEPGVIIYENRMSSSFEVGIGPRGAITRDSHYELLFQCRYIGTSIETLVVEVPLLDPPVPVAALGPIRVHMRLANGQCNTKGCNEVDVAYSSYYTEADYPVTKVLRDPVYVEVKLLERTDPLLVLTLGRCWTTTSPNPHSLPQWDILIDGCPYRDDRYMSSLVPVGPLSGVDFPSHYKRFIFKMFTFVDTNSMVPLSQQVYIHCSTAVCDSKSGGNCEPACYRQKRDAEAAQQRKAEPKVVVSSGPVTMGSPGE